jgi:hypothetical protein
MAVLKMEGFEQSRLDASIGTVVEANVTRWTTGRVAGSLAIELEGNASGGGQRPKLQLSVPSLSAIGLGFAFLGANGGNFDGDPWLQFREGSTVHLQLQADASGHLQIARGDGTVLGTTTQVFNLLVWNHLGFEIVVSDTVGVARLWVNGAAVLDLTGIDTRNGGTGVVDNIYANCSVNSNSSKLRFDDYYLTNGSYLGDCTVSTLRPNGNGATNQWIGSDANSVDNYLLVDDVATTTDYVESLTPGHQDLYAMTDLAAPPAGTLEVLAVQVEALAWKADAGAITDTLGLVRASTGTVTSFELADAAVLSQTAQWFRSPIYELDPDGVAWTKAEVDALQVGYEIGA